MQTNSKTLTKDAVKIVAERLMFNLMAITTLEIKNELRKEGYWATQRQVSTFMRDLCIENNYDSQTTGQYNIYRMKDNTNPPISILDNINSVALTHKVKGQDVITKDSPIDNDWIVTSVTKPTVTLYFDKNYKRDQVRNAYRSIIKVPIQVTRAKRFC